MQKSVPQSRTLGCYSDSTDFCLDAVKGLLLFENFVSSNNALHWVDKERTKTERFGLSLENSRSVLLESVSKINTQIGWACSITEDVVILLIWEDLKKTFNSIKQSSKEDQLGKGSSISRGIPSTDWRLEMNTRYWWPLTNTKNKDRTERGRWREEGRQGWRRK